jgi:hypothetical protein
MDLLEGQGVAVNWRDPVFARPTRTKVLPSGKVVRKTILLESDEEEPMPPEGSAVGAEDASGADRPLARALRALADLEEARRDGEITEAEYGAPAGSGRRGQAPGTR